MEKSLRYKKMPMSLMLQLMDILLSLCEVYFE
nr:MAG TPA: hypothetical protein [Caudoviricetes sp.]